MASTVLFNLSCSHLFLSLFFCSLCFFPSLALDNDTDHVSLLAFKARITDDPLQVMSSWNDTVPFCQWQGVSCSSSTPRVTMLLLPSRKLGGSLSPAIANLTFLQRLDLSGNSFRGRVPSEIGRLFRLQYLLLASNNFVGEIPANLSQCTELQVINMNSNSLTGTIPPEIATLPNLIALHVSTNQLTGGIPPFLGNISTLRNLSIALNSLGGSIPDDLGRLVNLEMLQVAANRLSGTLPPSIFNLSRLVMFAVTFNDLKGTLPSGIGNSLPNLRQLLVGMNGFSGMIPSSLSNASALQFIDLPDNMFTGKVPADLGRLANLQIFNVGRNSLGRGDPDALNFIDSLTNCSKLTRFGVDGNFFSGSLPNTVANLSITLNELLLGQNEFSGSIPEGITRLINLKILNVSWNRFDGTIFPDIGNLFNLGVLYMNHNALSGTIPSSVGNLTNLNRLRLEGNRLEGAIPSTVGNCRQLELLNLSDNNLIGEVPLQVFTLSSLTVSLNLARNSLNGTIPEDVGNLANLKELDLSNNQFSGNIPGGLGRCLSLEQLFLQHNTLDGSIPSSLSTLKAIQDLDLSQNALSGSIPDFLQDFMLLRHLNLSFNQLRGNVPRNGIFSNTRGVSLQGNRNLCGGNNELELPVCSGSASSASKRRLSPHLKVAIAIASGVLGSTIILCIAIFWIRKRPRRKSSTTFPALDWNSDFSYKELDKATDGFSQENIIGTGSFSTVYKGKLPKDGKYIAVKALKLQENRVSKMYLAECEALSNIRHRNLVKVLGCCTGLDSEGRDFRAIVLEYMPSGSLDNWLHPREQTHVNNLNILQRINIAIDVALALEYLHQYCHTPVAHCDLKPGNILLDSDLCAHLSDFGLAKFIRKHVDATHSISIGIRGTVGYVAPEYGMGGPASTSGDVYSFGIIILEMLTGRRPTDEMFAEGLSLHEYAKRGLSAKHVMEVVDPSIILLNEKDGKNQVEECLVMILKIGVGCSQRVPQDRMSIKDALVKLHLIKQTFTALAKS